MKCKHHGPAAQGVWACPSCLVDLRDEHKRLRSALQLAQEALLYVQADKECPSTTRQALAAINDAAEFAEIDAADKRFPME